MIKPILHLNLKKKWFDMVKSGEKKEEYRNISAYWTRIFSHYIRIKKKNYHPTDVIICFSNGYKKNRSQIFVECLHLHIGFGKPEWGAKDKQYFILSLGKIIPEIKS
jgi:hypothetical protein